jgi:predicted RNA-binding protein with RPS1 domain
MSSDITQSDDSSSQPVAPSQNAASTVEASATGPLNLERIRAMRQSLEQAQATPDQRRDKKPRPPKTTPAQDAEAPSAEATNENTDAATANVSTNEAASSDQPKSKNRDNRKGKRGDREKDQGFVPQFVKPRIAIPSTRTPLSDDQNIELEAELANADLDKLLIGDKALQVGRRLEAGQRYQAKIIKIHQDNVFASMGGPDEGVIPLLQFTDMPQVGQIVDCIIRSFDENEGLYLLAMPGEAIAVEDWSDLQNGAIVEVKIESANTGGLECKIGMIRGFIPMSQISEYRIEDASSYIGQTLPCVITEANERRGNLVLSHRAVLERERQAKRAERMAAIQVGDMIDATVRKVMDFGAFVDLGGLDGLIHISQLSWDKVKHPSEVVKEGLSYRSMDDHPWNNIDARFPIGGVVSGTVTRIAAFGVFVKVAPSIEGLVHVSEIAHRKISSPSSVVEEGQEVEVKVLSVDRESQRMSLSMKQAQAAPEVESKSEGEATAEVPAPKPTVAKYRGQLKGGVGTGSGGEAFGLKW